MTKSEKALFSALKALAHPDNFRVDHTIETIKARDKAHRNALRLLDKIASEEAGASGYHNVDPVSKEWRWNLM